MTTAVLFDLEDTLVQTPWVDPQHVVEFRTQTRKKLTNLGIPPSALEGIERATLLRNKAAEYIQQNFSKTDIERFQREMEKFLTAYEMDAARKSKLFPDTIITLERLDNLGIRMGLVTNTSAKAVNTIFGLHDLKKYFNVIVTRENVRKLKPDPEGILHAVRKLGANHFLMVGDLVHDAVAAKSANGKSIIVRRNATDLPDFQADYFVQSLSDTPVIIQKELGKTSC